MGGPRAATERTAAAAMLLVLVAVAGCRDSAAGTRPDDPDAGEDGPMRIEKPPAPDSGACVGTTDAGAPCPGDSCGGVLKSVASLLTGEVAQSGPAQACSGERVCVAKLPTAAGDGYYLSCVAPRPAAVPFGMPCATTGNARCADDSLCVQPAGGAAGAAVGEAFCATMCRLDADCPGDAFCIEYKTAPLPNKSYAMVGMCTPRAKIPGIATAVLCKSEAQCPAGQGCRVLGARTALQSCVPGGAKSLGTACGAGAECRSGECLDTGFRFATTGSRAACSGACWKNSDCGTSQVCVRAPQSDNGTSQDPSDDVVLGYCRTLVVADPTKACAGDQSCTVRATGDTCDSASGLCFSHTGSAAGACKVDTDCALGVACDTGTRFPGGACIASGCQPGASGADACPGGTVCAQRPSDAPLFRCYESCTASSDCHRFADGYRCNVGGGQPPNICLYDKGN